MLFERDHCDLMYVSHIGQSAPGKRAIFITLTLYRSRPWLQVLKQPQQKKQRLS